MTTKAKLMKSLGNKPRTGSVFKCPACKKEFYLKPHTAKQSAVHFCSYQCKHNYNLKRLTIECKNCGVGYTTYPTHVKWRGSSFCSRKCMGRWNSINKTGENSPTWQGGKSKIYRRIRSSKKFKDWRETVFKRDDWTCQDCGARSGNGRAIILHPHHIKSFTLFPELRFELSNGRTLCIFCHKQTHKINGYTKKQKAEIEKRSGQKMVLEVS